MAYESRIIIVDKHTHNYKENSYIYAEYIAEIKMGGMRHNFFDLFTQEIDYTVYVDDKETNTDCYGDVIKSAEPQAVIEWLENEVKTDDYRRLKPLLNLLKGFDLSQWENIQVLHYGY